MATDPSYTRLHDSIDALITALSEHPSYRPQSSQRSGPVFFIHDFVSNTQKMLDKLIAGSIESAQKDETRDDVVQRCMFTDILVNDTSGKLAMMTGEAPGSATDFGRIIKSKAKECQDAAGVIFEASRV